MTQRTKVEQDFLNDVDQVPGFHRRKDGKIEREVYEEQESNIGKVRGEYYYLVEIISEDDYLIYMRDEIEEVEKRDHQGEYTEK